MLEPLFTKLNPDRCLMCNEEALVFVDDNNNEYDYIETLNQVRNGVPNILDQVTMDHIKCKHCGRTYKISWRVPTYPRPIYKDIWEAIKNEAAKY